MKISVFLTILFFTGSLFAQEIVKYSGNWEFEDFPDREILADDQLMTLEEIFGEMFIDFTPDGNYKAGMMGQKDEGTWRLESGDIVMQSSKEANPVVLDILEFDGQTLTFKMANAKLKLKRSVSSRNNTAGAAVVVPVSADMSQIAKKWYLKIREFPGITDKQRELSKGLSRGAYFEFKENGKFKSELLGVKDKGTWKFGDGNSTLIITGQEGTLTWTITKVTETELVLMKGETQHRWVFSSVE